MKADIHFSTYREPKDPAFGVQPTHTIYSMSDMPVKVKPVQCPVGTTTGYGRRMTTPYMVMICNRWRRIYQDHYPNYSVMYLGHLNNYGERAIVTLRRKA